eukprot:1157543-Pelagomonas_calceolata.AAC.12
MGHRHAYKQQTDQVLLPEEWLKKMGNNYCYFSTGQASAPYKALLPPKLQGRFAEFLRENRDNATDQSKLLAEPHSWGVSP